MRLYTLGTGIRATRFITDDLNLILDPTTGLPWEYRKHDLFSVNIYDHGNIISDGEPIPVGTTAVVCPNFARKRVVPVVVEYAEISAYDPKDPLLAPTPTLDALIR